MSQTTAASQVTVLRADSMSSLESLNNITNAIRNRANQLAQGTAGPSGGSSGGSNSGGSNNDATSNWLQAERDLFCVPEATLSENDQQFNIQVAAAGCDSGNLEVIATSNSLVVRSTRSMSLNSSSGQGNIVYSDFDSRALFRRFDLASPIDTSQVTASLDNGMLNVSALKASASARRSTAARA